MWSNLAIGIGKIHYRSTSILNIVLLFIPSIVQSTVLLFFLPFYGSICIVLPFYLLIALSFYRLLYRSFYWSFCCSRKTFQIDNNNVILISVHCIYMCYIYMYSTANLFAASIQINFRLNWNLKGTSDAKFTFTCLHIMCLISVWTQPQPMIKIHSLFFFFYPQNT